MSLAKNVELIEAIEDEVNELHPLLLEILPHLEGISDVEYTHGPNEMGADFVLERRDKAVSETYYVGVVVKKEKILQNATDIERQISECFNVRRFVKNGKKEIRLEEVWVISSKTVSHNAKKKIHDTYQGRRISFLDSTWLAETVDKYYSIYWHQLPTATGSYLSQLSKLIASLDGQTSLTVGNGGSSAYIDLDVETIDASDYKRKSSSPRAKTRIVNFQEEVLRNNISLLEADMGFGKSKLVRRLVTDLAKPEMIKQTKVIPIFQAFITFSQSNYESLEKYVENQVGAAVYNEAKTYGQRFLLVLDGIDEANHEDEKCKDLITRLCNEVNGTNIHVLLSSRPFKLLEEVAAFGKSGVRYRIRPISVTKMVNYIIEICKQFNAPKRLYEDLGRSELFKQLPQNPIAAVLLSNLISQTSQDLPSNLTELYSKTMEFMLGRWDEKRAMSTEKEYKACERVARQLARYMVDNKIIYISKSEAEGMVVKYLRDRNIGVDEVEVSKYIFHRSGIFGEFGDSKTLFFRHRSFAEYLYARDAYEQRDLPITEQAFHPYWTNVYFFYLGSLSECPEQLRTLIALQPTETRARWVKLFQMGNYLLAGYQSPYAIVEDGLKDILVQFTQMYLDVRDGKVPSSLDTVSEMSLLCIFANVAKHILGYKFFQKALPLTMLQVDDSSNLSDEQKRYSLFFAACALAELNDLNGYDSLLKKHSTDVLPLPISFALDFETKSPLSAIARSPLVKTHLKRLHKLLAPKTKEYGFSENKLLALFEAPLKTVHSKVK